MTTGEAKRQDWETCTIIPAAMAADMRNGTLSDVAMTLQAAGMAPNAIPHLVHTLRGEGFDASEDGTGRGTPLVPVAFHHNAQASQLPGPGRDVSVSDSLTCSQQAAVAQAMAVRRLTPAECERLQGFPDGYTAIPWRGKPADACPDGPRYKALGNSWAVPCAAWIGARIARALA